MLLAVTLNSQIVTNLCKVKANNKMIMVDNHFRALFVFLILIYHRARIYDTNYWFDSSKYRQTIHDISKNNYATEGMGVGWHSSILPFGFKSGIYCAHRCVCATHFIYKTVKSVQGPQHFWTTKGVICQRKWSETNCPPPARLETSCFPSCKVSIMLLSISCHNQVEKLSFFTDFLQ